ncbi:MAG TPA: DegT/DnrJ/EryC1/StrS family aminotransferase [Gemmatimonadales bacterium]|nr:DegT/DnrJ/EryC1/StrS family aminotransferase [Gemmatimonadales bacterium]
MTTSATRNQIPFFRYPHLFNQYRDEILAALVDVMDRGAYILQKDLAEFEAAIERYIGVKHAWGVANGTDGLILALRAAGVEPGSEVIVPSHTYVASAASIHFVGATPVLVDCQDDHMISPAAVESAIGPRTTAIMPIQLNGRTAAMDELQRIADKHGLVIVEDAAQGLGSKYKGRPAGTFGAAAEFSLYPAKVLGCFGDGGIVTTNDDEVARKLMLLRDHGRNEDGLVVTWGLNSRLDNLQAAILNVRLKHFPAEIERRRQLARLYREGLGDVPELLLPPGPDNDPDHFDVYQNYEIEAERRDDLRRHLEQDGVRTIIQWAGTPVHGFGLPGVRVTDLPRTRLLFERCFLLPMNTSLTDDEVHYICDSIRRFYGRPV